jgi:hydroxymethylpyrimidine/phosphomethylpyrimidine kinase
MKNNRPYCLTIAGFDPTAGAGVLADIKTFESFGVYGMGIITSNTSQTDNEFVDVKWIDINDILSQMELLMKKYDFKALKIGLIKDFDTLLQVIQLAKELSPDIHIVWDPILKSSSGFNFHSEQSLQLRSLVDYCSLITPNWNEFETLWDVDPTKFSINETSSSILLKGGHRKEKKGYDLLYSSGQSIEISGNSFYGKSKHGTGCVLSAAIAANLAKGSNLLESCTIAKSYVEKFILSNDSNLGYHDNK